MAQSPFARRIASLREERGWSQNQLADRAGIRQADLSRILTGDRNVRPHHVVRLAIALDTTPDALLRRTGLDIDLTGGVPADIVEQSESGKATLEAQIEHLRGLVGDVLEELEKIQGQLADVPGGTKQVAVLEKVRGKLSKHATSGKKAKRGK